MTTADNPAAAFQKQVADNIRKMSEDSAFLGLSNIWNREAIRYGYAQNFTWLGRPVIQTPLDLYAYQELIWACRPDLIIETGIAHGGSLIMSASMLALLDYCDAIQKGGVFDPKASRRKAVGIDIDIRAHNRAAIDAHPLRHKIQMIEGSSVAPETATALAAAAQGYDRVMAFLELQPHPRARACGA